MEKTFPCSGCGGCCRLIGKMRANVEACPPELREEIKNFPYATDEEGVCSQLDEKNRCKVYRDRPVLCNINRLFLKYYQGKLTLRKFYEQNAAACNEIIDILGLDPKFKIDKKGIC